MNDITTRRWFWVGIVLALVAVSGNSAAGGVCLDIGGLETALDC